MPPLSGMKRRRITIGYTGPGVYGPSRRGSPAYRRVMRRLPMRPRIQRALQFRSNTTMTIKRAMKDLEIGYFWNNPGTPVPSVKDNTGSMIQSTSYAAIYTSPADVTYSGSASGNLYDFWGGLQFQLDQLCNATDIQAMFDRYCIKKIVFKVIYLDAAGSSTFTPGGLPYLLTSADYDNVGGTGSEPNTIKQRGDLKMTTFSAANSVRTITVYPRAQAVVSSNVAGTVTAGAATSRANTWVNSANDTIPHFGLRFCVRNLNVPAASITLSAQGAQVFHPVFRLEPTMYLGLKDLQ